MAAPKLSPLDTILSLAKKPAVSIFLDGDPESENALIGTKYTYQKKDRVLTIITSNLSGEDIQQLFPLIRQSFEENGLIIKDTQEDVLESYSDYVNQNPHIDLLEFFKDKIPTDDFDALKMSLFMRSEKDRGANITSYKNDIGDRFGARGIYIANLCNAGYFENEFKPLYNSSNPIAFQRRYEILVGQKARAIFIHSGMTLTIIQDYFDSLVEKALRYHLSDFRIHGFGAHNVEKIKTFIGNRVVDESEKFEIVLKSESQAPAAIEYDVIF